jgi:hypothetical protein
LHRRFACPYKSKARSGEVMVIVDAQAHIWGVDTSPRP